MADWRKLFKPGPEDIGTRHLDEITTPNGRGYTQIYQGRATKAQGYPWEGVAGYLEILPWNEGSGNVIAVFTAWHGGIAKRTFYIGEWRAWQDPMGRTVS